MTRTSLDDALWASLMLTMQQIPHAWKRDEAALRCFVEAVLWICRTGAPWRDLPDDLGHWPSVYHRFRRWSVRGWWDLLFEALRPALPADGLVLLDSTTCKALRLGRCAQQRRGGVPWAQPRRHVLETARLRRRRGPHPAADCQPRAALRSAPRPGACIRHTSP